MPYRHEAPALLTHKVLSVPGTTSPVSHWKGFEVPVASPTPVLERVQLPEPNIEQAKQLGRHAFLVPENDFAVFLKEAAETYLQEQTETLVFSAHELIESHDQITSETVVFAGHFGPDIIVIEDKGDKKIIVQRADVISQEYFSATCDVD